MAIFRIGSVVHFSSGIEVLAMVPAKFLRDKDGVKKTRITTYDNAKRGSEKFVTSCCVGKKMYVAENDKEREIYISELKEAIKNIVSTAIGCSCNPENLDKGSRLILDGLLEEEFVVPEGDYVLVGINKSREFYLGVFSKLSNDNFDCNGQKILLECRKCNHEIHHNIENSAEFCLCSDEDLIKVIPVIPDSEL